MISGAGPTVLALATAATVDAVAARTPRGWEVVPLAVESTGAAVVPVS